MFLFEIPGGIEWVILLAVIPIILVMLVLNILYLITLQAAFNTVSVENRKMPSGQVWLLLIPLFSMVWHFIVVDRLADSLRAEADKLSVFLPDRRPAYDIGLIMCILLIIIPFVGFIFWIIYWVKINEYKNLIARQKQLKQI